MRRSTCIVWCSYRADATHGQCPGAAPGLGSSWQCPVSPCGCPGVPSGIVTPLDPGPPSNTRVWCACPGHQAVLLQLYCCSGFKLSFLWHFIKNVTLHPISLISKAEPCPEAFELRWKTAGQLLVSGTLLMLSFTWVPLSWNPLFSQFVLLKGTQFIYPILELHSRAELGKARYRPFLMRLVVPFSALPWQCGLELVCAPFPVWGEGKASSVQSSVFERTGNTELLELSFYTTKRNRGLTSCHIFGY